MSENTFGILACRFRGFLGRSYLTPEITVDAIIEAVKLYNLLRCSSREFTRLLIPDQLQVHQGQVINEGRKGQVIHEGS